MLIHSIFDHLEPILTIIQTLFICYIKNDNSAIATPDETGDQTIELFLSSRIPEHELVNLISMHNHLFGRFET